MIVTLSDDLTGAVACAAEFEASGVTVDVRRWDAPSPNGSVDVTVIDTQSRPLTELAAARRIRTVIAAVQEQVGHRKTVWYKRIDSRMAGHWATELVAMSEALDRRCLIAPAAPELGVSVNDTLRSMQSALAAESISDVGAVDASTRIGDLAVALVKELETTRFLLCAASDREELVRLAAAVERLPADTLPVCAGTYGFARAWAAVRAIRAGASTGSGAVLAVVGSIASATQDQVARVARLGEVSSVRSNSPDVPGAIRARLALRDNVVLTATPADPSKPLATRALELATELMNVVRLHSPRALILVGGDLASAVNQRAGTCEIRILAEPWPAIPAVRFAGGELDGTIGLIKSGRLGSRNWLDNAISLLDHEGP